MRYNRNIGGLGDISYHWDGPQGYSSDEEYLWLNEIQPEMAGIYTLEVQDTASCTEAKQIRYNSRTITGNKFQPL